MRPTLPRRDFLARAAAAGCLGAGLWAEARAADSPPGSLKITKVETFAVRHKLPRAVGPSTKLYGFRVLAVLDVR